MEFEEEYMRVEPRILTVAEAIQELGDEVYAALPDSLAEEVAVAIRELETPEAELRVELLDRLAETLPPELLKKINNTRYLYSGTGGFSFPAVQAKCTMDKKEVAVGEHATVVVTVYGDTVQQTQPVPSAVVLCLDESGSMKYGQNYVHSRNAALTVLNSLRSGDEVALVTFADTAVVRSNLTTNHQSVKTILQGLGSPGGATNLEQAFKTSNSVLQASTTSFNRIVILFTDGMPYPNPTTQQQNILKGLGTAQSNLIQYYPVAYGSSVPVALLQSLAQQTGGKFALANLITDLATHFKSAFDSVKDTLFARDVRITDIVTSDFKIKPGSLNYSISTGVEPPDFKKAMKAAETSFYSTGTLKVPAIHILEKNRNFTFSFDVSAKKCSAKDQVRQVTSGKSTVMYSAGDGTKFTVWIKPVSVKVKACGVYWKKSFDQASRRVVIEINNSFSDRKVSNVRVVEITGEEVEPLVGTALPFWPQAMPYFPSHGTDVWKVYGVEWKLPAAIPASTTQKFSVEVKLRSGVDDKKHGFDNPVKVNQVKVAPIKDPDGKIVNKPKEGGVIEYEVPDDQGIKKKVTIDLPGLTVNQLPHQWPYS